MSLPSFLILLAFLWAGGSFSLQAEVREWTSANGTQIQAEIQAFDGATATLLHNGRPVEVPANQLSPEDQLYLKQWQAANPNPAPSGPVEWPDFVEAEDIEIKVIKEDEAEKAFVYLSNHYEFTSRVRLSPSVMRDLARVFESTYKLFEELPLGGNPRSREKIYLKVHLAETGRELTEMGFPYDDSTYYASKIDTVGVTLDNLGGTYENGRWDFRTARDLRLDKLRQKLTQQTVAPVYKAAPVWFGFGISLYVAELPYERARYTVSKHQDGFEDYLESRDLDKFFSMPDLKYLMTMPTRTWNDLVNERDTREVFTGFYALAYYFIHLDSDGGTPPMANFMKAITEGAKNSEARDKYLLRGRTYEQIAEDLEKKFAELRIEIGVRPPKAP